MKLNWVLLLMLMLIPSLGHAYDQYEDAMNEYRQGRYDEAFELLSRLASDGHREAQFRLGLMYHQGRGAPRNYREAVLWYRKAADQGHSGAQNNLGVIYRDGEGVRSNKVVAYMWFSLSAAQNNAAQRRVDQLEDDLSDDELIQAQQLTAEYVDRYRAVVRKKREQKIETATVYMVQLGLFRDPHNVERISERLKEAKIDVQIDQVNVKKKQFKRVRVGPFARESEAESVALRVDRLFRIKSLVVALSR